MAIQSNFPSLKPTLLLDFANTKQLDPRITFTRASTAKYYDGVTTAKAEENMISYSQDFDIAAWAQLNSSISANSSSAPDGSSTADTLTANGASAAHYVQSIQVPCSLGLTYAASCFVKAGTNNFVQLRTPAAIGGFYANFDVSGGSAGNTNATSSAITSVGNGWYRCSMVFTSTATANGSLQLFIVSSNTAAPVETNTLSTSLILWGAQLEQRSAVTAYTATTTAAITNYIPALQTAAAGVARFEHNPTTGESLGLLIEEQRTNLFTYSADFSSATWSKSNSTVSADTIVAPDGTLTGDKFVENTTATVSHQIGQVPSTTAGTAYTFSVFAKAGERTKITLVIAGSVLVDRTFDLSAGTSATGQIVATNPTSYSITAVGNGWYKCSISFTGASTTSDCRIYLSDGTTGTYTGNGFSGVYIWGAQLEAGAFATSYIPTVASQVTRSADAASMTGTNFSSWYTADQGTIYAETGPIADANYPTTCCITDGTSSNSILTQGNVTGNGQQLYVVSGGAVQVALSNQTLSLSNTKTASAYKVNDYAYSTQGATATTDTSALVPAVNQLVIGAERTSNQLNGTIKKIAFYPLRLTNTQLQALTS